MFHIWQVPSECQLQVFVVIISYGKANLTEDVTSIFQACEILKWESESESHSVVSASLQPHGLSSPWKSPGQNTGVGSLSLLWGIFPTQRWNPGLLQADSLPSEPPGKPQSWEGNKSWPKPEWKKRCYYVNLLFLNKEIIFKSIKELKVIVFPVLRKETMGC